MIFCLVITPATKKLRYYLTSLSVALGLLKAGKISPSSSVVNEAMVRGSAVTKCILGPALITIPVTAKALHLKAPILQLNAFSASTAAFDAIVYISASLSPTFSEI